jgi:hypothetical protein
MQWRKNDKIDASWSGRVIIVAKHEVVHWISFKTCAIKTSFYRKSKHLCMKKIILNVSEGDTVRSKKTKIRVDCDQKFQL